MRITERNAAEGLQSRDQQALEFVIDTYGDGVYRLVARICGQCSRQDLEECVSDVFMDVWNKIGKFDESRGTLRTWIFILAKYKALDYRRRGSNHPQEDIAAEDQPGGELTERMVLLKEERTQLIELVGRLPEIDRQVFIERYVHEERIEAIAVRLGLTGKAVESRLVRIRKWLKEQLKRERKEGWS